MDTKWTAGGVEEVGFMLGANHGGGYLYSVCPKSSPLTEQCLRGGSLAFVGSNHTVRLAVGETVYFDVIPSPSLLKHLLKREGGAAE